MPLLDVDITVDYPGKPGVLKGLQLAVEPGEIAGLIGESGSGKSTLALALMRLLDPRSSSIRGSVCFRGQNLLQLNERQMRRIRGKEIGLVLQSASSALNPVLRIEDQLREAWRAHESGRWSEGREHVANLLQRMELPADDAFLRKYPSQVSIGQAQRILIAMAVMHRPALILADEPTSALDVITQARVLRLLRELATTWDIAVLYISHDLPSVASVCDRLCILRKGEIVESGPCAEIFAAPVHPYTRDLIDALPFRHLPAAPLARF